MGVYATMGDKSKTSPPVRRRVHRGRGSNSLVFVLYLRSWHSFTNVLISFRFARFHLRASLLFSLTVTLQGRDIIFGCRIMTPCSTSWRRLDVPRAASGDYRTELTGVQEYLGFPFPGVCYSSYLMSRLLLHPY